MQSVEAQERFNMALPSQGSTLEQWEPQAQQNGLNTLKASNLAGMLVDTSGNVTLPGTLTYAAGNIPNVISGSGATVTLTAAQSGSLALMDRAAGIVFTLPTPAVGLVYNFAVTVTVTTNSYKVITNTGTVLLTGPVYGIDTDSTNAIAAYTGDGTANIAVTQAATGTNATGGIKGSMLTFRCITTLLWEVTGTVLQAGTAATPFANS